MIAFLITAYSSNEPAILRRLVLALSEPWTRFFIHVDKKSDITPFAEALADLPQVTFIDNRVKVYWGGWSQVQSTLNLLKAALDSQQPFRYFALISGGCYPIKSNIALRDFLYSDGCEYLGSVSVPNVEFQKPIQRFTCWFLEGAYRTPGPWAWIKRMLNRLLWHIPFRNVEKGLGGLQPFAGSSWWCLSDGAAQYIMDFVREKPEIVSFFRHTLIPDESFYQTVLKGSPYAARMKRSLTYADWSDPMERPCHIRESHLPQLLADEPVLPGQKPKPPRFFARKFSSRNADVIDRIEAERQRTPSFVQRS